MKKHSTSTAPSSSKKNEASISIRWIRFALAFTVMLLYGQTVAFDFTLDDVEFYEKNKLVEKGVAGIIDIFTETSLGEGGINTVNQPYRPVTMFSFALDKSIFGATASGGHWVNLLLYAVLIQVLFTLLRKLFPDVPPVVAGAIALLYAIHPIHSEVVASIKSRDELLAALFGFLAWIRFIRVGEHGVKSNTDYWFSACFLLIAMLSKESGIVFAALIPLSQWLLKSMSPASLVRNSIPLLLVSATFLLIRHAVIQDAPSTAILRAMDNILFTATDLNASTATRSAILFLYLKLLFVPWPLVWDYTYHQIPLNTWTDVLPWMGAMCYAGLIAVSVVYFRRLPAIVFGIALFLIALLPISNLFFINSTTLGERLLFLPSLGICSSLILTGWHLMSRQGNPVLRKSLLALAGILAIGSCVLTIRATAKWKDNFTLFQHGVDASPRSARTHFNLGVIYWEIVKKASDVDNMKNYTDQAIAEFRKSLEIYPDYFMAMTNLGCLYELKGDLDTSRIWFEQSLKSYPEQPVIPTNISNILNKQGSQAEVAGKQEEAKRLYEESAAYDKRNIAPLNSLGLLYARRHSYDSAFIYFNAALTINGEDRNALENFAVSSFLAKDYDQAIRLAQKHVLLYGNSRSMLGVMADSYHALGNDSAVARYVQLIGQFPQ